MVEIFKRLFFILLLIAGGILTKPYWEEPVRENTPKQLSEAFDTAGDFTSSMIEDIDFDALRQQASSLISSFTEAEIETAAEEAETPALSVPEAQFFSIGNIELGDTRETVEEMYGAPERESANEYGVEWAAYHESYQNFMKVAYDEEDMVRGLYTNQDMLSSRSDISLGTSQETVNEIMGEPEETLQSGPHIYQINDESAYDLYVLEGVHATLFYDVHQEDQVAAVQLIDEGLERSKDGLFAPGSEALAEGLEYQLFDLTNAARVKHDLTPLEWHEAVSVTARAHSTDMAENDYFSHQNQDGQSPFDRMAEDDISFSTAGENLAAGQPSSIFAHQGLMNSEGHRKNILQTRFEELGVGVAFNENDQPFYTEKFLTRSWFN
ncbi:CAP domain-containing protein [Lacicoccus alkaliphilus]|uniref:Cysteine-rich secretory protein family protein n=1 Tax=Lacicoccus alkaliphilus DSM 16010 TaxID=1123231 RepID=A0A1M7HMY7_9BACL|nr:CAP domain-containing protein [Salinicoccus alkaliphilus]SHM29814.1 Cysteine-rich secretory protein family protein [Salinicoccus alkaliphilus DSM 16010]